MTLQPTNSCHKLHAAFRSLLRQLMILHNIGQNEYPNPYTALYEDAK